MRTFFSTKWGQVIRVGIPWGIAIGIFYLLFRQYPPSQVFSALQRVNVGLFIALAVGYFLYVLVVDTLSTGWIFARFTKRLDRHDLFVARTATYPLSILNYGAGQAAFAYYLHKKGRLALADVVGTFFLIIATDLYWVIGLAFVGTLIHDHRIGDVILSPAVRGVAGIAVIALGLHLAFWRLGQLERFKRLPIWQRLQTWLERKHLVRIFREATVGDYARMALARLPIHAMFPIAFYTLTYLFHAPLPFAPVFSAIPLVILVGTIPITPGGLGTSNAAFVELLRPFLAPEMLPGATVAPQELILAMSLLWMFANYFLKATFGLLFLLRTPRDLLAAPETITRTATS